MRAALGACACAAGLTLFVAPIARAGDASASPSAFELGLRAPALPRPSLAYPRLPSVPEPGRRGAERPSESLFSWGVTDLGVARSELEAHRPELFPRIGVTISDASLSRDVPPLRAAQADPPAPPRLDAVGTYDLGHGFGLGLGLDDDDDSLATPHLPQLASLTGRLAYDLLPTNPVRATLFLRCGARWTDFENSQTLSSRLQERPGSLLTGGFLLSF